MHLEHLPLLRNGKASAPTTTGPAVGLHLLDHRPHADSLNLDAATVAVAALLHALLLVNHFSSDRHLARAPTVHLLQCDLEALHYIARLVTPASSLARAEEGIKNVSGVARTVGLQAVLPVAVVLGALVRVAQHL